MIFKLSLENWEGFSFAEMRDVMSREMEAGKHESQRVTREE